MADASYAQTSFLGGEISQWAQGRFDTPRYKIALNKMVNILPVDEGAAPRRPGFGFRGTTRNGAAGRLIPFDFAEATPYNLEFTDNFLRFWTGDKLVNSNDSQIVRSISNGTPAIFSLPAATTWKTGDQVYFTFSNPAEAVAGAVLLNRQFSLTMITPSAFSVADVITGVQIAASMLTPDTVGSFLFDGPVSAGPVSDEALSGSPSSRVILQELSPTVNRITEVSTPYSAASADWHSLRSVQGYNVAMLLQGSVAPRALQVLLPPTDTEFAVFEFGSAQFQDGPYLDPPGNAVATASGTSGVVQIIVGYPAWVSTTVYGIGVPVTYSGLDYISLTNKNQGQTPVTAPASWRSLPSGSMIGTNGFVQTDIGRMMRLFSAPENWDPTVTYSAGTNVAYNGSYFTSLTNSNTNNEPDISLTDWVINTSAAIYTWGTITQILSANAVDVQIQGSALLYTTPCPAFQIGVWSDTTGWPTCGCYQGGRFWFGGAVPNRFDASQPNDPFNMAPTTFDGTVLDSSGISYTLNANSSNPIFWMEPDHQGIIMGTQEAEWLITSGSSGSPITPSSITAARETKYGTANMLPVRTGLSICFVQRFRRRLLEYLADVFSGRFYGPDLTTFSRHLGVREFQEVAYQQEPAPIIWARMGDGSLVGTTYRRVSLFSTQEPEFNAWHQHELGSARLVESICVGPSNGGDFDTLAMVTNDPSTNIRYVETLTQLMDETDPLTQAWFLDCAVTPQAAAFITYGTPSADYVRFFGLNYLNGQKVSVFAAGLDCGDYIVEDGRVDVPLGLKDSITGFTFDITKFQILQPLVDDFQNMAVEVVGPTSYSIPCVIGFNYQSQGQLCRPMMQADTGTRNGPGFAKKRRTARYGVGLVDALGVQIGTDNSRMRPIAMTTPGGKALPYLSMFSGIIRDTLENDFSYDSMIAWQTTRPYPATVTMLGGFLTTEDV